MQILTWKLRYLEDRDPTPRRMLGWNVVTWSEDGSSDPKVDRKIRNWIKENVAKGTYRITYSYPECLIERDEDVMHMILKWSGHE